MDKREEIAFLFSIAKEIKKSFESPVILFTLNDYADGVYKSLLDMRKALFKKATSFQLSQIVNNFHLEWLKAVKDIDDFRKRINETPREVILTAIDYTLGCMDNRYTYFHDFIQDLRYTMPSEDRLIMQADLEIINDMKNTVISVLLDKKQCFKSHVDKSDYMVKLNDEVDELLNWMDRIYDSLAILCCKVSLSNVPQLPVDLTNTLKQIIDEVAGHRISKPSAVLEQIESKGKLLPTMVRFNASHELEVSKVVEKIKILEKRINVLKERKSFTVIALQHKLIYLEERHQSLENLKASLNALQMDSSREIDNNEVLDNAELNIFNHNLPIKYRCRLVEKLVKLWDNALHYADTKKSIISILSAADTKEVFTDVIGNFTVDKYGRKIYSRSNGSFQLNERNELVELSDDDRHIYFYDDCGRYYLDNKRNRIYKAHATASEYELHPSGKLLKLKEIRDGIEYYYDSRGRYYFNEEGNRIYIDPDTGEKYKLDRFDNIVRIRSKQHFYESCPPDIMVVKECKYLKKTVGSALKTCLANVLLHQPVDPIAFLADNLVKYRQSIEDAQKRREEETKMEAERLYYEPDNIPLPSYASVGGEISKSSYDYNLDIPMYQNMTPEE